MAFETIILEKKEHVATLTLNRPERRNAVNFQMMQELVAAIEDVAGDDDVRVLVITGAGRGFCSGADLTLMGGGAPEELTVEKIRRASMFQLGQKIVLGLQRMEKPTIAMVNGACVGMGADFALACDMRTGAEYTRFICGFTRIGLFPGFGATWLYPRVMGLGKAFETLFTGDPIGAEEAEKIGILNKVFPADKLEEETMNLARRIAKGPPIAIGLMKSQVYKGLEMDLEMALDNAATCEAITLMSQDHKEGVTAMLENREPSFQRR
ncbi:MAG: enoyl-CoA hydratase/isomerase family protein [Dehalococcoidia bacterium]|nr:enoyl-CoA hydratase/isomerase family protein [Dehalococcoidia bacterium]